MKQVFQVLKKAKFAIVFVIALLVLQAYCDLSLPAFTSDIVNVGIQQSGIESSIPEVIRASQMDTLKQFATKDFEVVEKYYEFVAATDKKEAVYKQKEDVTEAELDQLKDVMTVPMLITLMKDSVESEDVEGNQSNEMSSMNREDFDKLDDMMLEQYRYAFVKAEYEAQGVDLSNLQINYIVTIGAKMLGLALVAMLATILVTFFGARIGTSVAKELRSRVFRKVMMFTNKELDEYSTASLITRCTNDIQQIQQLLVMMLRMIFYAPIIGVGAFIQVLYTGGEMTWVIGIALVAMLLIVLVLLLVAMPKFQILQKLVDRINLVAREILVGLPVIRAFSKEKQEEERFEKANEDLMKTNLFVNRIMSIMMPTMFLVMNGISVLIVWAGIDFVDAGTMQVGDIMAFIQYAMQIIMAFLMLSMMSIMLPRALVSVKRIGEVLSTEISIVDTKEVKTFGEVKKGYLTFEDVSFSYPNAEEEVLKNITFSAKPGETTAIIGSTGCGKTTLINLIPRFYDVTKGRILIDDIDIREVSQHSLRDKLGYVPQKAMLFSGTIASNITYGNETATKEEIEKAAQVAQATEFITSKTEGYEEFIAQGGGNVSGGQKQRLSIARAIAKHPEIYIFDDSFSALDYKTDITLRKALKNETKNSTILIVAQRISTVLNADQIIVLEDGEIAGIGKHEELLEHCEVYRQIAFSQLSEAELKGNKGGTSHE